jgi:osmotically-inducible protein OsmY
VRRVAEAEENVVDIAHHSLQTADAELRSAILEVLDDDPCTPGPNIGVAVTNHVVTLTSTVLSEAERVATLSTVRHVTGVLTVVDDIVVPDAQQFDRTEHDIALAVEQELMRVVDEVPTVQAIVRGRVVTLTGIANDHRQKYSLVFAIRDIPGVTWVDDQVVNRALREPV